MIRTGRPISSRPAVCSGSASFAFSSLGERDDDLRPHDARADLGGAVDRRVVALPRLEQLEGALGHGDVAEALGHDDREPDLLGAGDRHAEVVAEDLLEILVVDAAGHDGRGPDLDGLRRSPRGSARAPPMTMHPFISGLMRSAVSSCSWLTAAMRIVP